MVMKRRAFIRTLAGAALPIKLPSLTRKTHHAMPGPPRGIYVVCPIADPSLANETCWHNDQIQGVLLRTTWANVAPDPNTLDFSYFYNGLALANQYDKQCMISVAFGEQCPPWVLPLVQNWNFTSGSGGVMPAPWDNAAQQLISNVIRALSDRFARDPRISAISCWAGGRDNEECFFAQSTPDVNALNALGGPTVWSGASKFFLAKWKAYFPGTQLYLATGNCYAPDGGLGATMTDVSTYALGLGFGLQSNGFSTQFPVFNPSLGYIPIPHTSLPVTVTEEIGYQFVEPIRNAAMHGATMAQALAAGQADNGKWIQIYPSDASADPGQASIIAFNEYVGAN
jgi:hypothetical protein